MGFVVNYMKITSRITTYIITILLCLFIITGTVFWMRGWSLAVHIGLYVAGGLGISAATVFFIIKKHALLKTTLVVAVCAVILFITVVILNYAAGLNEYETNGQKIEKLTQIIRSAGGWSMAVYVLIQVLQVVILPLPAAVCYIPGAMIWRPWEATLLASAGVIIGAVICYVIGRFSGRKVVEWIAGKEATHKYADYLGRRGKTLFVMMQILPFFPDDILCLVAGLTKMNFPFFIITMLVVRPVIVAAYCYLGSGDIIPFSGWGIPVWIAIAAVCIVLAVLSFKYQDKFESWLKSKFTKNKNDAPKDGE